jgi:hypothetical protein
VIAVILISNEILCQQVVAGKHAEAWDKVGNNGGLIVTILLL